MLCYVVLCHGVTNESGASDRTDTHCVLCVCVDKVAGSGCVCRRGGGCGQ